MRQNTGRASTHGLLLDVVEGVGSGVDNLALDLVGPAGVVSQAADDVCDISSGHADGLAVVERLNGGKGADLALNKVGELVQELAAVLGSDGPPCALEGLAGGGDGNVNVLLSTLVDGADDFLGGGIDDLEGLALCSLHELIVDEAVAKVRGSGWQSGVVGACYLQTNGLLVLASGRGLELNGERHVVCVYGRSWV